MLDHVVNRQRVLRLLKTMLSCEEPDRTDAFRES